jgi:phosphotransferase system enzyme I (PtsI)
VRSGVSLIVDGGAGEIHLDPSAEALARAEDRREVWLGIERRSLDTERDLPTRTRGGVEIAVRANIEFPGELGHALAFGAQGTGLYRSEYLFLSHSPHLPSEEVHYRTYRSIAESVAPHPAVIRTLDLGGEKYFHEVLDRDEPNPVLGLRAVRLCLKRPDLFAPQLRGLLRAATHSNLRIMLPMVTNPDEIRAVRRLIAREVEQLKAEGTAARADLPVGIMIEVPGAAASADLLAREADFFSLGTNDLIQYALAVDRGNESVSYLYQPTHPGVLRMLKFVVDSAADHGIPLSVCGEMAADVETVALLVGLGVRELSVQPRAIASVRQMIREMDRREAVRDAARALRGGGAAAVREEEVERT